MNISYYAVIPTTILAHEKLSDSEKIIYGVISSLTIKEGFCFASNEYISDIVNKTAEAVRVGIYRLSQKGLLFLNGTGKERKIYLHQKDVPAVQPVQSVQESVPAVQESVPTVQSLSIYNNKEDIKEIIKSLPLSFLDFFNSYPHKESSKNDDKFKLECYEIYKNFDSKKLQQVTKAIEIYSKSKSYTDGIVYNFKNFLSKFYVDYVEIQNESVEESNQNEALESFKGRCKQANEVLKAVIEAGKISVEGAIAKSFDIKFLRDFFNDVELGAMSTLGFKSFLDLEDLNLYAKNVVAQLK